MRYREAKTNLISRSLVGLSDFSVCPPVRSSICLVKDASFVLLNLEPGSEMVVQSLGDYLRPSDLFNLQSFLYGQMFVLGFSSFTTELLLDKTNINCTSMFLRSELASQQLCPENGWTQNRDGESGLHFVVVEKKLLSLSTCDSQLSAIRRALDYDGRRLYEKTLSGTVSVTKISSGIESP